MADAAPAGASAAEEIAMTALHTARRARAQGLTAAAYLLEMAALEAAAEADETRPPHRAPIRFGLLRSIAFRRPR
jgi:hypothetical protein